MFIQPEGDRVSDTVDLYEHMFCHGDPPKLDLQTDKGSDFTTWRIQWDSYRSLSGLDQETSAKQVKAPMLCISRETLAIVQNLTEEQMGEICAIIEAMQCYVDSHINKTVGTSDTEFSSQGSLLTIFCLERCTQKNIHDQIIEGLSDGNTVELLQILDTTITKCRSRRSTV